MNPQNTSKPNYFKSARENKQFTLKEAGHRINVSGSQVRTIESNLNLLADKYSQKLSFLPNEEQAILFLYDRKAKQYMTYLQITTAEMLDILEHYYPVPFRRISPDTLSLKRKDKLDSGIEILNVTNQIFNSLVAHMIDIKERLTFRYILSKTKDEWMETTHISYGTIDAISKNLKEWCAENNINFNSYPLSLPYDRYTKTDSYYAKHLPPFTVFFIDSAHHDRPYGIFYRDLNDIPKRVPDKPKHLKISHLAYVENYINNHPSNHKLHYYTHVDKIGLEHITIETITDVKKYQDLLMLLGIYQDIKNDILSIYNLPRY